MAVRVQALTLSGLQKAASLLIQIGKDRVAQVMSEVSDNEVETLPVEIIRMSSMPCEISVEAIDEFYENSVVASSLQLGHGGLGYVQKVLEQALGRGKTEEIMERLMQGMQG